MKVTINCLKKINLKPEIIVEVGARDCLETVTFAKIYQDAHIYSFECDPLIIEVCKKNISPYSNITLYQKAVSGHIGNLDFHVMPTDPGSSSAFIHNSIPQNVISVECTTLENEFDQIDLLWMDAQGSELNILKATNLKELKVIHTEIFFTHLYKNVPMYRDIKKYLNANGFYLYKFSSLGNTFADAIFINKETYKTPIPQWLIEAHFFITGRIIGKMKNIFNKFTKNK